MFLHKAFKFILKLFLQIERLKTITIICEFKYYFQIFVQRMLNVQLKFILKIIVIYNCFNFIIA